MQIDIEVRKIEKEGSSLVGFANVTFAWKLRVNGIKLMKRKDGQMYLSKIVGIASITLNNAFRINDIIIRKDAKDNQFVSMPSYRTGKQDEKERIFIRIFAIR
ncbi:MAG: SpoVG family protein [Lachnospiraceae bacterium]|jgi:DNA-binding cell septation regulator SpoVG|nr:SpoVG family protein [Lachnospiraceae bacterium]